MSCSALRFFRCLCGCVISSLLSLVDASLNFFSDWCGCVVCSSRVKSFLFGGGGRRKREGSKRGTRPGAGGLGRGGEERSNVTGGKVGGEWKGRRILKPVGK
ncbi:hypothetical protein ElyMa_000441900 [Elysia marginata]|uniref:Secreted protein n=1 Tax=Elysia marginata TaxID=1093978 RepID=A0AAV4FN65_9GAST|nr:hypothetical protein ElyMa_000441900 [Elysia marginata]